MIWITAFRDLDHNDSGVKSWQLLSVGSDHEHASCRSTDSLGTINCTIPFRGLVYLKKHQNSSIAAD